MQSRPDAFEAIIQFAYRLCYLLIGKYYINACFLQNFNILATTETTHLTVATLKTDLIILYTNIIIQNLNIYFYLKINKSPTHKVLHALIKETI